MNSYLSGAIGAAVGIVMWVLLHSCADGRTLLPSSKEIVVREVANGYLVEARVKNGVYPYQEYVFTDAAVAGSAVAGLLNERLPSPKWGR